MVDLGVLGLTLKADTGQATKDLNAFTGQTEKTESKLSSFANSAGKVAKGAIVGLTGAVVAGTTAIVGMATSAMGTADNIDKMSQKIGIGREAYQEMAFVMSQCGTDVDVLKNGLKTMTGIMDATASGTSKTATAFEELGISVINADGTLRNQEEVMFEAFEALQGMTNETEKAKMATELFGKAGLEMMPMLNGASGSIDEMRQQAHDLGLVMGDEAIDAGVRMTDSLDKMKRSFGAICTEIGARFMPIFASMMDWVVDKMPKIQETMSNAFKVIETFIAPVIECVKMLIDWIGKLVEEASTQGTELNTFLDEWKTRFEERFNAILEFIKAFCDLCAKFWDEWGEYIIQAFKTTWAIVEGIFGTAFDVITDLLKVWTAIMNGDIDGAIEAIKTMYSNLFKNIIEMLTNWWEEAKKNLAIIWEKLKEMIKNMIDGVIGFGVDMFNAGKSIFTSLWEGIKSVWNNICSWVEEKVEWIADKLTFWKKSEAEMNKDNANVDGSHANGINFVPYDGYFAELHKGEKVLTAEQAKQYSGVSTSRMENLLEQLNNKLDRLPRNLAVESRF